MRIQHTATVRVSLEQAVNADRQSFYDLLDASFGLPIPVEDICFTVQRVEHHNILVLYLTGTTDEDDLTIALEYQNAFQRSQDDPHRAERTTGP